ncbi:hypothetical protein C8R43DRAFT_984055 [Mycena crocata]|nr:hypothetical protein C8R43DRAFT_984055 [Mycena crocata]
MTPLHSDFIYDNNATPLQSGLDRVAASQSRPASYPLVMRSRPASSFSFLSLLLSGETIAYPGPGAFRLVAMLNDIPLAFHFPARTLSGLSLVSCNLPNPILRILHSWIHCALVPAPPATPGPDRVHVNPSICKICAGSLRSPVLCSVNPHPAQLPRPSHMRHPRPGRPSGSGCSPSRLALNTRTCTTPFVPLVLKVDARPPPNTVTPYTSRSDLLHLGTQPIFLLLTRHLPLAAWLVTVASPASRRSSRALSEQVSECVLLLADTRGYVGGRSAGNADRERRTFLARALAHSGGG